MVEVRIDFIPPGFPTEPISEYLTNNHGEILTTPFRITDRFNIQPGTRVFKMERKNLDNNPKPSYLYFGQYKFRVRYQGQNTTCGYCAEKDHIERNCPKKANMKILAKTLNCKEDRPRRPKINNKNRLRKKKWSNRSKETSQKKRRKKMKPANALSPTPATHR